MLNRRPESLRDKPRGRVRLWLATALLGAVPLAGALVGSAAGGSEGNGVTSKGVLAVGSPDTETCSPWACGQNHNQVLI